MSAGAASKADNRGSRKRHNSKELGRGKTQAYPCEKPGSKGGGWERTSDSSRKRENRIGTQKRGAKPEKDRADVTIGDERMEVGRGETRPDKPLKRTTLRQNKEEKSKAATSKASKGGEVELQEARCNSGPDEKNPNSLALERRGL